LPQGEFISPEEDKSQGFPARRSRDGTDGGLIGGAALKADQFAPIINAANQE